MNYGKALGFMLFFIGLGMVIGLLDPQKMCTCGSAGVFLLCGYHFFVNNGYEKIISESFHTPFYVTIHLLK